MIIQHEGKVIGTITDRVLHKNITSDNQLMEVFGGTPGFQDTVLQFEDQFDSIEVTHEDIVFRTSRKNWRENFERRNFGHGWQYFMHRKHWEINNAGDQPMNI